jgi:hypothetical protein
VHRSFSRELLSALLINVVCVASYWIVESLLPAAWVRPRDGSLFNVEFSVFIWSTGIAMVLVGVWLRNTRVRVNHDHPREANLILLFPIWPIIPPAVALSAVLTNEVLITSRGVASKVCFCAAGFVLASEVGVLFVRVGQRAEERGVI